MGLITGDVRQSVIGRLVVTYHLVNVYWSVESCYSPLV